MTSTTTATVISTNVAVRQADPAGNDRDTGIDKQPEPGISISAPGENYGDGSGVEGDFIGDTVWHGGNHKAVYAFAREELDFWEEELERGFGDGAFGENLTTQGIVWAQTVINQRVHIDDVVLEVSLPRTPCATFAQWLGEKGWLKKFNAHGEAGAYLRVISGGHIEPGTPIELGPAPDHGITMGELYRAKQGDLELAQRVLDAGIVPDNYAAQLQEMVDKRS